MAAWPGNPVPTSEAGLGFGDLGGFLFFHGGGFAGEFEAGARSVVLDVVGEVPGAGKRLAGVVALTAGR